jgi:uncharacterized membrane protein YkoI
MTRAGRGSRRPRPGGRELRRRCRRERERLVVHGRHDDAAGSERSGSQNPWGAQRSDETPLIGDTLAKVKAAALAEVPDAMIVRVETDADGNAAYEAHVVKADGTPATVYVDKQFDVVSVESR